MGTLPSGRLPSLQKCLGSQRKPGPSLHPCRVTDGLSLPLRCDYRGPSEVASGYRSNEGELVCDRVVKLGTEPSVLGTGL